ncbi:hypothetical protein [Micromonospora sp. SL4-19]
MTVTEENCLSHYERIGGAASVKAADDVVADVRDVLVQDQVVTSAKPEGV